MNYEIIWFIRSELTELESRDLDQLAGCITDNIREMGVTPDDVSDSEIYNMIEKELL